MNARAQAWEAAVPGADVSGRVAAVIAVYHRPVQGTRGMYRVNLRHGVSRVHAGRRHAAGLIFHDAA